MSENKQFWLNFFELYKSLPELWKVDSAEYKDRDMKTRAYNILIEKCKEIEPTSNKYYVARKINSFRSTYRRELKKINQAAKNGKEYQTTLWFFDHLNFLQQEEDPLEGLCNELESENSASENSNDQSIKKNSFERAEIKIKQPSSSSIKKKKHRPVNSDELLELATKRLKRSDDYSQTLANVWANEFRMASEQQRFFAKKAIDDILFEARCGTLHRNSVKINENNLNDYVDYQPGTSKREAYQSLSPGSNHDSITIERYENEDC